ncbi:MAG: sugar ABC transporter permease [Clostridiales bacterium]|nr:sugar ABC transporter permease [Clostridiales bacterium]
MIRETEGSLDIATKRSLYIRAKKEIKKNWQVYVMLIPLTAFYIVFYLMPLYGVQIAFRNFSPSKGIWGSDWVGLDNFKKFFYSPYFKLVIKNTFLISIYNLAVGIPLPIILALIINHERNAGFKRVVQTISYAPHFISTVVIVGMLKMFLSPYNGIVSIIVNALGGTAQNYMAKPELFRHLYVWSGVWQNLGFSAIIYIAALTAVSPELHEAAVIDGANVLKRIWHIDIPGILPTVVIMTILSIGSILSVGYEKVYLMQNDLNGDVSEVISTYVYKQGLLSAKYSYASAAGLFNSVVNFTMLVIANYISGKLGETSLF